MTLAYTVHPEGTLAFNTNGVVPCLTYGPFEGNAALGVNTPSARITGPKEVRLIASVDHKLDMRATAGLLDPVNSPLTLKAGVETWFRIPAGDCYLSVA